VFLVLPELGTVRGIFLINGVASIPSVLMAFCASDVKVSRSREEGAPDVNQRRSLEEGASEVNHRHPREDLGVSDVNEENNEKNNRKQKCKRTVVFTLNIVIILLQFGYIPFILRLDHAVPTSDLNHKTYDIVLFVVAMFFISFSWWENFTDDRFCGPMSDSGWKTFILKTKFDLQESRPVITACTSFVKIGLIFLFSWLIKIYHPNNAEGRNAKNIVRVTFKEAFGYFTTLPFSDKSSILTLILSAFVGYYVGYTACKLKLQRFSFNIPLILSTPLAVVVTSLDCTKGGNSVLFPFTTEDRECNEKPERKLIWLQYVYGFAVWLSLYWLCRHIFYPNIERLAKTER
jgi:hypothetical protein